MMILYGCLRHIGERTVVAIGYLIVAVLAIILHQGRKSWFEGPDDFDYV